jgi:hypothetical protein
LEGQFQGGATVRIEFSGSVVSFDDLPIGGFFMSELNRGGAFGLCVSIADTKKAVIVFPNKGSSQESVSLETGGLANETFIHFAGAVLRPDLESVMAGEAGSPFGALISLDGHYYIRAQDGRLRHHYRTFNVQSGLAEDPKGTGSAFHFARWKAGLMIDQKFEPIFSLPAAAQQGDQ